MTDTAHSSRAHATLAPSAAHRWLKCPGSISMSAGVVENPSVYAAEGTAAHELAAACLESGHDASHYLGASVDTESGRICTAKPDGKTTFPVTPEMVEAVQMYVDLAREIAEQSEEFEIEQRLDASGFVPGVYGMGDFVAYRSSPSRRVTVCDLKYGVGVAVDVEENEQLLTYALGLCNRFHNRGVDEVELIIVQPRASHRGGPIRRWVTDVLTLVEHAMAMQAAAEQAMKPDAALVPGSHCQFCRAAGICPALRDHALAIVGAQRNTNGEIIAMSDPRAVKFQPWRIEAANLAMIKGWAKAREEHAHAQAIRGELPPESKLVARRATRQWRDAGTAAETLQMLGVSDDDLFDTKMCSPAQVEKALPKSQRSIISDLAAAVSSGTALAPIDDPRPGVDALNASGFEATEIEER